MRYDYAGRPHAPAGTVAFIHTHPWQIGEWQTTCGSVNSPYYGLPSADDVRASQTLNLPGYILDKKQITKFDGAAGTSPVNSIRSQYTRCGY